MELTPASHTTPLPAEATDWLPVIDVTGVDTAHPQTCAHTAAAIRAACEGNGFFIVIGHGIPPYLVNDLRTMTRKLFCGPDEARSGLTADPADPLLRGLMSRGIEPVEAYTINALGEPGARAALGEDVDPALCLPNKCPPIPGFVQAYRAYMSAAGDLAARIMRLFAISLGVAEDWFAPCFEPNMSSLTTNHYPALDQDQDQALGLANGLRKIAHRDWGSLTILHRDEGAGGLEVFCRDRIWREVPDVPESFVVNVGDLMAVWTEERFRSAVHRVVAPPPELAGHDRLSIAYFCQPGPTALISAIPGGRDPSAGLRHRPQRADAYFAGKSRQAFITEQLMNRATRDRADHTGRRL
ncbi:2OG-Fe(II) oxygenase family protein [Streptosporangium sp. NPDC004631]